MSFYAPVIIIEEPYVWEVTMWDCGSALLYERVITVIKVCCSNNIGFLFFKKKKNKKQKVYFDFISKLHIKTSGEKAVRKGRRAKETATEIENERREEREKQREGQKGIHKER